MITPINCTNEISNHHRLLTIEEVMGFLYISRDTIYRIIKKGNLKTIRVGRQRRILMEELQDYIKRQTE